MSELRTNKIYPRDGLVSGANGGIVQVVMLLLIHISRLHQQLSCNNCFSINNTNIGI